jgi:hypothetical protein
MRTNIRILRFATTWTPSQSMVREANPTYLYCNSLASLTQRATMNMTF